MALAHNLTSLFCCLGAWIFFVIGCIGNSSDVENVKHAPWIRSQGKDFDLWVGTQAFVYDDNSGSGEQITKFRSCESNIDFCTNCKDAGRVTFALLVIAVIFSMVAIILSAINLGGEHFSVQYATVASTGSSFVMALVGWCVFMRRCYHAIDDDVSRDMYYGAGGALTLLGYLLMGIAVIVNVVNVMNKPAAAPQSVPTQETNAAV